MNPAAGSKPLFQGDPPSELFTKIRQVADHPALNSGAGCHLIDLLQLVLNGGLADGGRMQVPERLLQGNATGRLLMMPPWRRNHAGGPFFSGIPHRASVVCISFVVHAYCCLSVMIATPRP